jgi:hypothetical protein
MESGERKSLLSTGVAMLILGSLSAVAGYVPYIAVAEPNLAGLHSRGNLFAIPGAAAAIVAILFLGAALIGRSRQDVKLMLAAGAVPFIAIGLATQIWIQRDWSDSWQTQKQLWNALFEIAPDLNPDTSVHFILPGYREQSSGPVYWKQPPLAVEWAANFGLRVLYGSDEVEADVILPVQDVGDWFTEQGIVNTTSSEVTPYEDSLILLFDGDPRHLRVVTDPAVELGIGNPTPGYAPYARIRYDSVPDVPLRRLVE